MFERHAAIMLLIEPQTGAILDANQAAVIFYGYSKAELCEMLIQEINMLPPEQVAAERQKAFSEERNYFVFPHRLAGGEERIVEVRSSPVDWMGKQVFFSIIHDITDNKRTEKALRESEAMLQKVQEVAHMGSWEIDLNTKTVVASDEAHRIYGISQGSMTLDYVQSVPLPEFRPILDASLTTLFTEGKRYDVEFKIKRRSDGEIRDIHSIAEYNASSRTIIGSVQDITERKRGEEALKKSEIWFKSLFENASDGIFYFSIENELVEVNHAFARMHGYSVEEMRKMKLSDFDTPENTSQFPERMRRIMNGEACKFEAEHFHKDGHTFPLEVTTSMISVGDKKYVLAFHREITERKLAEEALRASEALYRQAIEVAGAVPYLQSYTGRDLELHYDFIGEGIRKITGYGPEEFNGDLWDSLTQERSVLENLAGYSFDEAIERVRSGISPVWKCEHHIRARDGNMHWVFESAVELRDENGVSHGSIGTFQDITERKQAEAALRESEALYQKAIEVANAVPYHQAYHVNSKAVDYDFIGEGIRQITGYGPEEFDEDKWDSLIQESVLLDDLAGYSWLEAIERVRSGVSPVWRCNHRIRARDGSMHWVFEAAVELRDENGVSHGSIGMFQDITERKQAEEALATSETKLRALVEQVPAIVYTESAETREALYISPQVEKLTGYTPAEWIHDQNLWKKIVHPEDLAAVVAEDERTAVTHEPFHVEYSILTRDGRTLWINDESVLVQDQKGTPLFWQGLMHDITERKQVEEALLQRNHQLEVLSRASQRINAVLEIPVILRQLVAAALELTGAADGTAGEVLGDKMVFKEYNMAGELMSIDYQFVSGYGVPGWVMQTRAPYVSNDAERDPHVIPEIQKRLGFRNLADVPILNRRSELLGCFEIHNKPGGFDDTDVLMLQGLAAGAGIAWENAAMLIERKLAEEALATSEAKLRALVEQVPAIVYTESAETRETLYISPQVEKLTGYTSAEWIKERYLWKKMVHPDDLAAVVAEDERTAVTHEPFHVEYRFLTRDGRMLWINDESVFIKNQDGTPLFWQGVMHDITERKQAEEALRESEERFRTLYDNATIGLYRTTPDGHILMSNPVGIRMLGFDSFDEIAKRDLENVGFGPEYLRKEFREKLESEGVVIGLESKWIKKDGSEIFVRENAKVFRDENGEALYYDGSFEDITERKRTEDQLRKLSRAVEQNPASIVITDLLGNIEYVNPRFSQVTGYSFEESLGQNPRILKSGNTTQEEYKIMWDTILTGNVWQGEFLNKTKNGETYWEFATITPVFGEDGKITNFLALKENITERKQAEENLERANLDLRLAYDATIEGWSRAMDLRDHETEGHTLRVTDLTMKLARAMRISESQLTAIRRGALLHDIGKMGVPDAILLKEGDLTDEEWALMRRHPQLAYDMLAPIAYLNDAIDIPYCHHEKWDGTGYPQGLKGDHIPLIARIFAVVDVWDALTNDRTYRSKWSKQETVQYIKEQSGRHFDPQVVDVFLKNISIDS